MAKNKVEMPKEDLAVRNFTNIDSEDFQGMWAGQVYLVKAGETKQFPGFLVDHFCKHLSRNILIKQGAKVFIDDVKTPNFRTPDL